MSNPVFDRIQHDVTDNNVVLYMKGTPVFPQCGFSAAVVQMPQMIFHPVKTLVGQMKLLCLRANGVNWSGQNSLRTFANSGGAFIDSGSTALTSFATGTSITTQDYTLSWGTVSGCRNEGI